MKSCEYCNSANNDDREKCHSCGAPFKVVINKTLKSFSDEELAKMSASQLNDLLKYYF